MTTITVGVSLLAKAVGQPMKISTDLTPSRASRAPTGSVVFTECADDYDHCGSGLARESGGPADEDIA
jgi:hypothetical protein